jgi:hypothetical protein
MASGTASGLRKVSAELLTTLGWLSGTLHVPSHVPLEEHIALGRHHLKLTGVAVPGEPDRMRFLALRRDAVVVVAPAMAEAEAAPSPFSTPRHVACLLPAAILRGTLQVFSNMRLSDHLQIEGQVVTLRHCLLTQYGGTAHSANARPLHTAIVNLSWAIGVSEED